MQGDKDIWKEARKQGWEVEKTRGGHMRLKLPTRPDLPPIHTASSRSDWRGRKRLIAHMRRYGFVWQGR